MYLDVVAELDCALVVDAEDGIIIIEDEKPLAATIESKELVLCSLVNHSENQGYQIVENESILVEVLTKLILELIQVVLA